jgi:glycine/D-amino acid oxidase-like deaminating enzyme
MGVLWLCYHEKTPLIDDSIPFAKKYNMDYELLDLESLKKRYPHISTTHIHHAVYDPFGGYLKARESMQCVQDAFIAEGGSFQHAYVEPQMKGSQLLLESEGKYLQADFFLFACGSWLGKMFPEVLGSIITCTKQEVYYFGVPKNFVDVFDNMPVWVDVDGINYYYGIPGNANRGFKIGVDQRGENFDPTEGERISNQETLAKARRFIAHRFPALKNAPLLESRVCPYENSPDGNFVFQAHPASDQVWFLGGGSGHGFKHGPALGEWVANCICGKNPREAFG